MKTIYNKLMNIQSELKAPKGQYNSFGKYNYRNTEDILEALKPLLKEHGATLTISDDIVLVGDRYYVKATATLIDIENGDSISNSAFAREELDKKGMDSSQLTGSTSSYARKYSLNGLFAIDDSKDSDYLNTHESKPQPSQTQTQVRVSTQSFVKQPQQTNIQQPIQSQGKQCIQCGEIMEYKEGISQKTGNPYKMYRCQNCNNVEFVND